MKEDTSRDNAPERESDEELVKKAQSGDEAAMEAILKRYMWLTRSVARKYFLTNGDYDDLIQEGLIGLYKGIMEYKAFENGTLLGYLSMVINSDIKDAVRRSTRAKQRILTEATTLEDFDEHIPTRYIYDPVHNYIEREGVEMFYKKLEMMFRPMHVTILKYYLEGYTYAEIGELTGLPTKKVDNMLTFIKRKIKKNEEFFQ